MRTTPVPFGRTTRMSPGVVPTKAMSLLSGDQLNPAWLLGGSATRWVPSACTVRPRLPQPHGHREGGRQPAARRAHRHPFRPPRRLFPGGAGSRGDRRDPAEPAAARLDLLQPDPEALSVSLT